MPELILITSLFTLGLFIAGSGNFVLAPVRQMIAKLFNGRYMLDSGEEYFYFENGSWIWKPFWGCPACMASFWGVVVYSIFSNYSIDSIYELPILILCCCGLNFILYNNLIKKHLLQ